MWNKSPLKRKKPHFPRAQMACLKKKNWKNKPTLLTHFTNRKQSSACWDWYLVEDAAWDKVPLSSFVAWCTTTSCLALAPKLLNDLSEQDCVPARCQLAQRGKLNYSMRTGFGEGLGNVSHFPELGASQEFKWTRAGREPSTQDFTDTSSGFWDCRNKAAISYYLPPYRMGIEHHLH